MPSPPRLSGSVQLKAVPAVPEQRWLVIGAKDGILSSSAPAAIVSSIVIVSESPSASVTV